MTGRGVIRVGTRGSALAVTQTNWVAERLAAATGREMSIIRVTTHGDVNRASLASLGGMGVFATELRQALLEGHCDVVVHSLKDLPTAPAPGMEIAAYPAREDVRDALCARGGANGPRLADLPRGARVGTGSPRRVAQLLRARPDLDIRDIRGNVDTRLGYVESGDLDAVVLAAAGLRRLGREAVISDYLPLDAFPTAPGQGCLAVETRAGDGSVDCTALDDLAARLTVLCERAILAKLEAGCAAPLGVTAKLTDGILECAASVYATDGSRCIQASGSAALAEVDAVADAVADAQARTADAQAVHAVQAAAAEHLASEITAELLDRGAGALL